MSLSAPGMTKLYNVDAANDNDGEPIEAYIERTDWTIGGENNIWSNVLIRSIYPVITGSEGDTVRIKVAGSRSPGKALEWSPEREYIIGQTTGKIDALVHGRYLNLRISSSGGNPWELHRVGVGYIEKAKF